MDLTVSGGRIVLLTGERGSGKTSACERLAVMARDSGFDCAGIVSPAVVEDGVKVGIDVADVRTGERRRLATVDERRDGLRLGPFRFDHDSLAWGARRVEMACPCDVLLVDELGPLELEREAGWANALGVLRQGEYGLGVVVVRPSLLLASRDRLGGRVAAVVTASSEDPATEVARELAAWARGLASSGRGRGPAAG
jgi:nucleoside-triphosphatase THEP1